MAVRLIVRTVDVGAACNVGGPVNVLYKSFDLHVPELESFLKKNQVKYVTSEVIGAELVEDDREKVDLLTETQAMHDTH